MSLLGDALAKAIGGGGGEPVRRIFDFVCISKGSFCQ